MSRSTYLFPLDSDRDWVYTVTNVLKGVQAEGSVFYYITSDLCRFSS